MCDLGEAAVKNDPSKCHAMGHRCWERIIETEVRRPVAPISPLTLHEAFDYLDTAWRLAFDKKALLGHGSMVRVARLAFPCTSQEEFESRLSDLSVILKDLNIPDSLLPPENSLTKDKTLLRLAECLKKHIDPSAHEETKRAVKTLQTVNDIRTNLQHGWTRRPLPTALNDLGISYPLRWDDGWVRIQEITAESLRVIREKVQEYAREVANGT
jgi:hypothetical protein